MKKLWTILLIALFLLSGCQNGQVEKEYSTIKDFKDARIGTFAGSTVEAVVDKHFPDAKKLYFNSLTELTLALDTGKIDGFALDKTFYQGIRWEKDDFSYLDDSLAKMDYCYGFANSDDGKVLKLLIDSYIYKIEEDGTLQSLQKKWFSNVEPNESFDFNQLEDINGTLNVALSSDNKPYIYLKNNQYTGFEVEILYRFGQEYGFALNLIEMNFDGALMGVESGKYDLVAFALNPSKEREEAMLFSEPTITSDVVMIVNRPEDVNHFTTVEEFENGTIGILTGSIYDTLAKKAFPNAELKYYTSFPDILISAEQGKVDGFFTYTASLVSMRWEGANLVPIGESHGTVDVAYGYIKENEKHPAIIELNAFLKKCDQDGTLMHYREKWLGDTEPTEHPDYKSLEDINGTLKVAVFEGSRPISYLKEDFYTGYEIDLLTLFAKEYGYALDLEGLSFNAIIPSLVTGKYDLAAGNLAITEERQESISFSYPHFKSDTYLVVLEEEIEETSFLDEFKDDFNKTFIREDRWKLIVSGIGVTMLISICASIIGTLFGFVLFLLTRSQYNTVSSIAKRFAKIYSRIVAGTPTVVILMVLFYVVFGSVRNISGVFVSILSFSFTFGSFVYNHMNVSVSSVDYGQNEAAQTLGYGKNKAFFRIILPQAMEIFMPSYCGQIVELIKGTAIVGYVAVNDLTKVGDIIRSNTYEAFFPLISIALIYFLLTWLITIILEHIKKKFDPYNRNIATILKGTSASKEICND